MWTGSAGNDWRVMIRLKVINVCLRHLLCSLGWNQILPSHYLMISKHQNSVAYNNAYSLNNFWISTFFYFCFIFFWSLGDPIVALVLRHRLLFHYILLPDVPLRQLRACKEAWSLPTKIGVVAMFVSFPSFSVHLIVFIPTSSQVTTRLWVPPWMIRVSYWPQRDSQHLGYGSNVQQWPMDNLTKQNIPRTTKVQQTGKKKSRCWCSF